MLWQTTAIHDDIANVPSENAVKRGQRGNLTSNGLCGHIRVRRFGGWIIPGGLSFSALLLVLRKSFERRRSMARMERIKSCSAIFEAFIARNSLVWSMVGFYGVSTQQCSHPRSCHGTLPPFRRMEGRAVLWRVIELVHSIIEFCSHFPQYAKRIYSCSSQLLYLVMTSSTPVVGNSVVKRRSVGSRSLAEPAPTCGVIPILSHQFHPRPAIAVGHFYRSLLLDMFSQTRFSWRFL